MTSNERRQVDVGEVEQPLSPYLDSNAVKEMSEAWIEEAGADPQAAYEAKQLNRPKAADPLVGKVLFGTYQIIEPLGEGAMGIVYKARHLAFDRLVAMKTLKVDDPELLARFTREVKLHGALKHQNIVEAIDCLQAPNGKTFFVMEFVDGVTLESVIRDQENRLSEEGIFEIATQVASALGYAHQQGIIHRDLKPGNMIVNEREGKITVKVMDFGIAKLQESVQKLTKTGQAVGSPIYMSPEQCMGQDLDGRADLYSLGVMLYELITGSVPFLGNNLVATMEKHCIPDLHVFKPLSDYSLELKGQEMMQSILERCLSIAPTDRYQSCLELKKALEFWYKSVSRSDGSVKFPTELALPNTKVPALSTNSPGSSVKAGKLSNENSKDSTDERVRLETTRGKNFFSKPMILSISVGILLALSILGVLFFFMKFIPTSNTNSPNLSPAPAPAVIPGPAPQVVPMPTQTPKLPSEEIKPIPAPPADHTQPSKVRKDQSVRPKAKEAPVPRAVPKTAAVKPASRARAESSGKPKSRAETKDTNPFSRLRLQKD